MKLQEVCGTYGPEIGMRPGTKLHHWRVNFIFNGGGMGDFLNYSAATHWLSKKCPWVIGRLFVPRFLVEIMQDIHPSWEVIPSEEFGRHVTEGMHLIGPDIHVNGQNISHQFMNCVGSHPVDVGFAYYTSSTPPPPDGLLPVLNYARPSDMPDRYVVITTGNVQESRKTTGKHINPIIEHVVSRGLMPVFLGKRNFVGPNNTVATFPDDVHYHEGIDLRDQTTVKEAAAIMQHAECTVGLDNGLLHLAALMKDSRIVFGYNVTSVAHREPRRNHGKHINVTLDPKELACIGCQSKLKQIAVHKFDKCLYGDSACVELLFADGAARWKRAIDEILEGK